jgi:hypothetical protein
VPAQVGDENHADVVVRRMKKIEWRLRRAATTAIPTLLQGGVGGHKARPYATGTIRVVFGGLDDRW